MCKQKTYKIELAAERLLDEIRFSLKKAVAFFFTIPKNRDDKMIYILETISWIALTFAIILRWRG